MKFVPILTAAALAVSALGASAQDYPDRPVEFIVPWSPGGGSDTLMRIVSNNAEPYLGAPLPVINIPGVSGTTGLKEAARRDPDGYTVAQIHEGLPVATKTGITDVSWDQFDPIALMTSSPQYLVVNASSEWQTLEDFVTYASENPGDVRMGVTLGGVPHLHAAMIEEATGAQFSYVGYEGTGERIRALVGDNLDAAIGDIASAGEFVKNGDLRFLAVGSTERLDATPDVPTFQEWDYDLELAVTRGIVMPKGSPEDVRASFESAMEELAADETYVEQINNAGGVVDFRGQDEYRSYLETLDGNIDRLVDRISG